MRAYGKFDGALREALHRLKYQHDIALGESLSKHLIELYNQCKWEVDMIIPVPLSPQRRKERGYNQSGLLARPLAYAEGIPYRPSALRRTLEIRSQVGLTLSERRANVHGAFSADPAAVRGKRVLVVDDVSTTGSTADACAQALRAAGSADIYVITLARAMIKTHTEIQPHPNYPKRR
jgi:ComF family protein